MHGKKTQDTYYAEFIVVSNEREPILGLDTCIEWKLIKRMDVDAIACSQGDKKNLLKTIGIYFTELANSPGSFRFTYTKTRS